MTLPTVRQLFFLCLFWLLGCWSTTDASPYNQWEDGIELRKVRSIQSDDFNDILWRDQDEEHVKNVFKRFLFHYSKARNSVGAVQQESHSAHPLMRLLPKLSQRRKKVLLLRKHPSKLKALSDFVATRKWTMELPTKQASKNK
ncbi:neuromedin-S isoform X4 [Lates calcarifer]|uniref:Neuromedin-S isoform X1 n=1 Tax=Lates calcarifer TaxID=8187 RepID=A0AAJ8B495_LATCA|nr:neuromedin-S isoform X1 [Lates calcarifer]XP_050925655.1 neuromedin-S isoform X2 [Lates calcarifer]XP_050925656.1 neuromedin-S isoform X3 [Lates calcarifer]XP_050925657.1 neuromedin-S isoform X4 [Lates calcarifer]